MIELFIDEQRIELTAGCSVELSASLNETTAPGQVKEKIYPLALPMCGRNRVALGFPEQCFSPKRFNQEQHAGKIVCRGATLLQGRIELTECQTHADGTGSYRINLRVPPPAWVERAAQKKLAETAIHYDRTLDGTTIRESWTDDSPVKFLPVKWDAETSYGQEQVTLNTLYYENYYPFVQIRALLEAIAEAAGYRIESQFLNEPFFQSLYMSGKYGGFRAPEEVSRMDFAARRNAAARTARFDKDGRVFTNNTYDNSVGNLVDGPDETDAGSNAYYGKSFRMIDNRPAFVPEQDVIAAFEIRLKFRAPMKIASPTTLQGVSKITWGEEVLYRSDLDNPVADQKAGGGQAGTYRVVSFTPGTGAQKITSYTPAGSSRSMTISHNTTLYIPEPFVRATCEEYMNGRYTLHENWALYNEDEYRKLTAGLDKEYDLTLRSTPMLRPKNEALYFDTLVFEGGATADELTLYPQATVRPLFYAMPEAGKPTAFASLFAHQATQLELVEAVAHLFGLHFYTDDAAGTIYIEPRFTFLKDTHPIDWTEKIDPEQPVVWQEMGSERYQTETLGYRDGDAPTERAGAGTGKTCGQWSTDCSDRFARRGERILKNPLFTATRDERNSLRSAPAASMIVVGNRNTRKGAQEIPEKIIRYIGIRPLPDEQLWGWPAEERAYPAAGFSPGLDWFTLCFDDENGQLGLKNYHQPLYELAEKGKKMTLNLHLTPSDMEAVCYPNPACRDFRGNFVFRLRGETIRARLVEIHRYNPTGASTRCTFTVEP